jgi:hypothetical protein
MRWLEGGHAAEVAKQPGFLWCRKIRASTYDAVRHRLEAAFLAYGRKRGVESKFAKEREAFEKHMKIERFHGKVDFSL